jgi:hypothetical protein
MNSELTSDLNLPSIKSCIDCHSPQGGIDHRCTSCHTYHNHSSPFSPLGGMEGRIENPPPPKK